MNNGPLRLIGFLIGIVLLVVMTKSDFMSYRKGGDSYDAPYSSYGRYRRGRNQADNFTIALLGTVAVVRALMFAASRRSYGSGSGAGAGSSYSYGQRQASASGQQFRQPRPSPRSNFLLPNGTVTPKAEATLAVLNGIAATDPAFDPARLEAMTREVFMRFKGAWQARDLAPLDGAVMPSLLDSYKARVQDFKAKRQVNKLEGLKVQHVDFVHVRRPESPEGRSVTALVTASAADYLADELSGQRLGGDQEPQVFQEFWTFYRLCDSWALARIDRASDSVALTAPNLPQVPPAVRPGAVPPAPAPEFAAFTAAGASAAPLEKQSPLWDRQKMEIAATLAFESVYDAWGRNDVSLLKPEFMTAGAALRLGKIMDARKAEGISFELSNFFTRRAEVVMTSPAAADGGPSEFTARITATAVRGMLRNGKPLHRDQSPQPFTEYWVFARAENDWKLSDILPRMEQESSETGQDGAPGPAQIEWYWDQGRA